MVEKGKLTDCQGLAYFANALVEQQLGNRENGTGSSFFNVDKFVKGFATFTPNQTGAEALLVSTISPTMYRAMLPQGKTSGFAKQYQDSNPNADQTHHFAAFLQIGYSFGSAAGSSIAKLYERLEGTPGNAGDIALGSIAAQIGSELGNGSLLPENLGERINNDLCKH